jgi:hypothetical protein
MEQKEIKIQVPDGYEIDKDKSTFENIVFKPIGDKDPKSWEEAFMCNPIEGYYLNGGTIQGYSNGAATSDDANVFKTIPQAISALAYAQLTQLMALPCYNGDWVPDWSNGAKTKYTIIRVKDQLEKNEASCWYVSIAFKNPVIRDIFYDNHQDLLRQYHEL